MSRPKRENREAGENPARTRHCEVDVRNARSAKSGDLPGDGDAAFEVTRLVRGA